MGDPAYSPISGMGNRSRIKMSMASGTVRFTEEFPHFRFRGKLLLALRASNCGDVSDGVF